MEGQAKTDCYLFMEEQEPVSVLNDTKSIRTGDYCFLAICLCVLISVFKNLELSDFFAICMVCGK